ncbi:MAG: type II secretion system F family protein [Lachnospiraceae bacterium]|nr:type II secretion system F family protein [Lachnospiraceae bacterium]
MSLLKRIFHGAVSAGLVASLAYGFYRSWKAMFALFPVGIAWYLHSMREERRRVLESGRGTFRDGMRSISSALSAGYSPENAVREAAGELEQLYGGRNEVVREFKLMVHKLNMNRPVEVVLSEAAENLELEDLQSFAEVFGVARRSGGQLVAIIGDTVEVMEDKQETEEEVATVLTGKQFEQKILTVFPLALIAYLNLSAEAFFSILYTTLLGRVVMSICLAVYLAAVCLSWKISRISV